MRLESGSGARAVAAAAATNSTSTAAVSRRATKGNARRRIGRAYLFESVGVSPPSSPTRRGRFAVPPYREERPR